MESAVSAAGSLPHPTSTRFIAYEELREATNNFEPASVLGEGGFGRVFKGVLNDGTAVAIKRLTTGGQQGDKEFLVEVEMLSRLHHRNLVKLVGYYSNRDSSQNLLCYELVPNGSLEAWLHGNAISEMKGSVFQYRITCFVSSIVTLIVISEIISLCLIEICPDFPRSLGNKLPSGLGHQNEDCT